MSKTNRVPTIESKRKEEKMSEEKKTDTNVATINSSIMENIYKGGLSILAPDPLGLKYAANWLIDDNPQGPAITKVFCKLSREGSLGGNRGMAPYINRIVSLMEHGFVLEGRFGVVTLDQMKDEHVRGEIEAATAKGAKIVFIDEIGSTDWRKVGDEYAIHVLCSRDGKARKVDVQVGSHSGWKVGVVTLDVTPNGIYYLHPDLLARDVGEAKPKVEFVEP